jgi:hypothetical protein
MYFKIKRTNIMSSSDNDGGKALVYLFIVAALHNPLWTAEEDAQQVLENSQTSKHINITEVGGYSWMGCGLTVAGWQTKFEGYEKKEDGSNGRYIAGSVCEGLFADSYLRFEH